MNPLKIVAIIVGVGILAVIIFIFILYCYRKRVRQGSWETTNLYDPIPTTVTTTPLI